MGASFPSSLEHEDQCEEDEYGWEHEDHFKKEGCNLRRRPMQWEGWVQFENKKTTAKTEDIYNLRTWRPMQKRGRVQLENKKTNVEWKRTIVENTTTNAKKRMIRTLKTWRPIQRGEWL
jgi:hypothetical protein